MTGRSIWIGLPAYTGQVHIPTMRSILTDTLKLAERGDKVHIFDDCGNAMIADCRALMLAQAIASDCTDFVFVDTDVSWEAGKLVELIDNSAEFRVGIYPQRRDPLNFSVRWDQSKAKLVADADNGLLGIDGAPAGFIVVSRGVIEKMTAAYPELTCWNGSAPSEAYCALFDPYWIKDHLLSDGRRVRLKLGEDFSFCQRWLDLGGKVYVDPEIRMGHTGYKTFTGSLGEWLRDRPT